ncbi:MAG: GH32 C-terminal domain-containing protein, partial [Alkalispirochaeta sp.]
PRQGTFQIILRFGAAGVVTVTRTAGSMRVDRSGCDMGDFNSLVDTDKTVPLPPHNATAAGTSTGAAARTATPAVTTHGTVDLIVDRSILEIFFDGGALVTTDLLFPREGLSAIECVVGAGNPPVACTVHAVQETIPR